MENTPKSASARHAESKGSIYDIGNCGPLLWQIFVLAASVVSVVLIGGTFAPRLSPAVVELLRQLDAVVCLIFFSDFILQTWKAPDRWRYLRTWGWIDLLSSIPLMMEPFGVVRIARIFRIFRVIRVVRGSDLRLRKFASNPAQATLFTIGMLFLVVVTLSSTAMLIVEEDASSPINTAGDALWWCMVTLSTVGYGDVVPVTRAGRVIAVLTMLGGIAVFSTFTAFVASTFLAARQTNGLTRAEFADLVERLDRIERNLPNSQSPSEAPEPSNSPAVPRGESPQNLQ